jgi:hypothetical protein
VTSVKVAIAQEVLRHRTAVALVGASTNDELQEFYDDIIRYNLSGIVNRRLIGDDRTRLRFNFIFLLIEARRYEHAGCANCIHC